MGKPAPDAMLTPSLKLLGPLARGGMGSLWLAHHSGLGAEVVVKFLDEASLLDADDVVRFEREASLLARVRASHVVGYVEHGVYAGGRPYLVLERLKGCDLAAAIRRHGPLAPALVGEIVGQMARALTPVHEAGIVHRDLKPSNIFLCGGLCRPPFVKLLDFGVAKSVQAGDTLTGKGQFIGTLHFMSPEQILQQAPVDYRADLWALGVVTYQALTGRLPFANDSAVEAVNKVLEGKMPPPSTLRPELPATVDAWFQQACAVAPDDRFASAKAMSRALFESLGLPHPCGTPACHPSPPSRPSEGGRAARPSGASPNAPPPGAQAHSPGSAPAHKAASSHAADLSRAAPTRPAPGAPPSTKTALLFALTLGAALGCGLRYCVTVLE